MKKILSVLLALTLVFSCAMPVLAVEYPDTRDTNFFTPHDHTDLSLSDIPYEHIDPAPLLAEIEALDELAKDTANAAEFETRFLKLADEVERFDAMYVILYNKKSADSKDTWAEEEFAAVELDVMDVEDAFNALVRDVLDSPCANVLASKMSDDVKQDYLDYENLTDEAKALQAQDTALESEYMSKVVDPYTVTIDGVEYDDDSLLDAYYDEEIDYDTYVAASREIARNENAVLGEVYMKMIDVRNQIAKLNGYDNYADYAYSEVYGRDYTVEDVEAFAAAVKTHLAPKLNKLLAAYEPADQSEMPDDVAYSGHGMFGTLLPYFAQLSDELLESAQYTYDHGFYDVDPAPNKTGTAYSYLIPYYEAPFYFNNASGSYTDLTTTIHELGHNNAAYWKSEKWNEPSMIIDVAEVHSQALELLMLHFYPELFGTQADSVADFTTLNILYAIVDGCQYDELQRYAYSTPNVTLKQINEKYRQLCSDYGFVDADDPRTEMYGWYEVPHNFTSPMYYISYATSAAGAFAFWEESQEDYFQAVDHYLQFTAQSNALGFQDSFKGVGMESPLSAHYIKALADAVHEKLMLVDPYSDVYLDDWYGDAVNFVTYYELMNGGTDGAFAPTATATREQAMTILARMNDEREDAEAPYTIAEGIAWAIENNVSDGTNPKNTLTREQFVTMLYRDFGGDELEGGYLDEFDDADTVSDWAAEAMEWAVEAGIVSGYGDGLLHSGDALQRSQMATMLMNYIYYVFSYADSAA